MYTPEGYWKKWKTLFQSIFYKLSSILLLFSLPVYLNPAKEKLKRIFLAAFGS